MRPKIAIALLLLAMPAAVSAKSKKPEVSAVFANATYVYVESPDGSLYQPGLYRGDRQAIADVQDALRDWNRYKLTSQRDQAELIFVVRKGRIANGRIGGGVGVPQPLPPGQIPHGPGQAGGDSGPAGGPGLEAGAEAGPEDDMLRVYTLDPDHKLMGPIWNRTQTDGLEAPRLLLFQQLESAVEKAYPSATASQPSKP